MGRGPNDLVPDEAMDDAVLRATRMLGAQKVRSAHCTVVFDPRVVSTLLAVVASALSGEAVVKGRSFFAGRIGETIATNGITLVDDPTDPRAYGASSHDGEGLACRRNVLIAEGVLRMFVYDTVSARRAGTVSTGSASRGGFAGTPGAGCRALVLAPGTRDQDEILAAVGDGLYVQSVSGIHSGVNTVSGDFSVGAEGLMIEGGALDHPGARGDGGLHAAADAAVGRRSRGRPALASRRGRGPDPGHRRHGAQRRLTSTQPAVALPAVVQPAVVQLAVLEAGVESLLEVPLSAGPLSEPPVLSGVDSFLGDDSEVEDSLPPDSELFFPELPLAEAARESVL